jgi:hypothetical protein
MGVSTQEGFKPKKYSSAVISVNMSRTMPFSLDRK